MGSTLRLLSKPLRIWQFSVARDWESVKGILCLIKALLMSRKNCFILSTFVQSINIITVWDDNKEGIPALAIPNIANNPHVIRSYKPYQTIPNHQHPKTSPEPGEASSEEVYIKKKRKRSESCPLHVFNWSFCSSLWNACKNNRTCFRFLFEPFGICHSPASISALIFLTLNPPILIPPIFFDSNSPISDCYRLPPLDRFSTITTSFRPPRLSQSTTPDFDLNCLLRLQCTQFWQFSPLDPISTNEHANCW